MSTSDDVLALLGISSEGLARAVVRAAPGAPVRVTTIYYQLGADGVPEEVRRTETVESIDEEAIAHVSRSAKPAA